MNLSYTLDTIDEAVKKFWDAVPPFSVIAFSAEMGAGKTTFIHHLCDYLRVDDAVSSPTFALINEYHFNDENRVNTIYHLDWYRLKNAGEAIAAGMEDCIDRAMNGEAYCFIEWPEKAPELLLPPYIWVTIALTSITERVMTINIVS